MSRPLRVLSVRQPFASALFGPKPGENRTWCPALTTLRYGDWLAIHASVSPYTGGRYLLGEYRVNGMWPDAPAWKDLPRDAVLGVVRLAEYWTARNARRNGDAWALDDASVYWLFDRRVLFPTPIKPPPAKPMAHAGLWLAPPEVVAAARAVGVAL